MAQPTGLDNWPAVSDPQTMAGGESLERTSFSELRGSVGEVLRVLSVRRWMLCLPFCVITSGAFIISLTIPRRYEAVATFERRDDPVLMNLPRSHGAGVFEVFRQTLIQDFTNPQYMVGVVKALGLLPESSGGADAAAYENQVMAAAGKIASGMKVSFRQRNPHLDVVELRYATNKPDTMVAILDGVLKNYFEMTQSRIGAYLRDTKDWFDQEVDKRQEVVQSLEDEKVRFKKEHRGIDPLNPDASFVELATLRSDLTELERRGRELAIRLDSRVRLLDFRSSSEQAQEFEDPSTGPYRSPEASRIIGEMNRVEARIHDLKSAHGMTEVHPDVVAIRADWSRLSRELESRKALDANLTMVNGLGWLPSGEQPRGRGWRSWDAASVQAESEATVLRQLVADNEAEISRQRKSVRELEQAQELAVQHHRRFAEKQAQIDHARNDVVTYQRYADEVGRLLAAERDQRGILFDVISPAKGMAHPVSPRASTVLLLTLLAGVICSVIMVLLSEILDRTIRTRRQVSRVLGLPILESIDEIVSSAVRRKRMVHQLVVIPLMALALGGLVAASGSLAYVSLHHQSFYHRLLSRAGWTSAAGESASTADPVMNTVNQPLEQSERWDESLTP